MKKRFIEKRALAAVIFAAAALLSTLASGSVALNRERGKAERIFTDGVESDGMSISHDLDQRAEAAYNLAGVAKRYLGEDAPEIAELLSARSGLVGAVEISEKYDANLELSVAADALYSRLKEEELSEKDSTLAAGQYQDMLSHNDVISRDGYNSAALSFNRRLEGFPAAQIAAIAGIEPLDTFN